MLYDTKKPPHENLCGGFFLLQQSLTFTHLKCQAVASQSSVKHTSQAQE